MRFLNLSFLLVLLACSNKVLNQEEEANNFPVENIIVLNEKVCLKENKICQNFYIEYLKTELDWVNKLLEQRIFNNRIGTMEEQSKNFALGSKQLLEKYSNNPDFIDWSFLHSQIFLSKKNNILAFSEDVSIYTGEAEPSDGTYYFNIDLEKQKILTIEDIIIPEAKEVLVNKLKELSPENNNNDEAFNNLDNFRFESNSLVFLFNSNEINRDLIELKIPYSEIIEILNEEFFTTNFAIEFPKTKK